MKTWFFQATINARGLRRGNEIGGYSGCLRGKKRQVKKWASFLGAFTVRFI